LGSVLRFAGMFLDLSDDSKKLWPSIRSFGLKSEGSDNVEFAFSVDELYIYFTSPVAGTEKFIFVSVCLSLSQFCPGYD
jgi:hypothetical protein